MEFIFLGALAVIKKVTSSLRDKWTFKGDLHTWRKWLNFEFWPAWFFYLPIVPYYIFLSLRHRSFLLPFYANPNLKHGGLIGESKWDFLKYLDSGSENTLPAFFAEEGISLRDLQSRVAASGMDFPLIIKPDVGQRGFGVRVLKDMQDLVDYLSLGEGDLILQKKSQKDCEAGAFYIRYPGSSQGFLYSVTNKKFPFVVGDGKSPLGDLILRDKRARIIAPTYFERHKDALNGILLEGEKFFLSECGNHCQGALFFDGEELATSALLAAIEKLVGSIPDFYFGRIDIRYRDKESLKKGLHFEVVEINGSGSEATHNLVLRVCNEDLNGSKLRYVCGDFSPKTFG